MTGPVRPVAVGPDEWEQWRALRLEALQDAPTAFTRTYAETLPWPEQQWRALLDRPGGWWLVLSPGPGGRPLAMAAAFEDDGGAWLGAVYVTPLARGTGLLDGLLAVAADWTARAGHPRLLLEVHEDNAPARAAYARLGFVATGGRRPLPLGAGVELEMSLSLPVTPLPEALPAATALR